MLHGYNDYYAAQMLSYGSCVTFNDTWTWEILKRILEKENSYFQKQNSKTYGFDVSETIIYAECGGRPARR